MNHRVSTLVASLRVLPYLSAGWKYFVARRSMLLRICSAFSHFMSSSVIFISMWRILWP